MLIPSISIPSIAIPRISRLDIYLQYNINLVSDIILDVPKVPLQYAMQGSSSV
jgi:hypothetical protein